MKRSEQIGQLAKALAAAQAKIEVAPKDNVAKVKMKSGGEYQYSYSTLADVRFACRDALAEQGLSVVQATEVEGAKVSVTTLLAHSSGEWIENTIVLHAVETTPQAIGSCITYARRYELGSMVGVVSDEDEDGSAGSGRHATTSRRPHTNGYEQAKPKAEQPKEDPSLKLCEEYRHDLAEAKTFDEVTGLEADFAAAHKAHSVSDAQAKWWTDQVAKKRAALKTLQEQAA